MTCLIVSTAAVSVSLVAAATDWRSGRIPNKLTFSAMLLGLACGAGLHGASGLLESAVGLVLCAAVPGVVYKASQGRGIGGGDLKLFAALGALLGPSDGLEAELSSFLALGLFALFQLAFKGELWATISRTLRVLGGLLLPSLRPSASAQGANLVEMRMGPAIALGVIIVLAQPYWARWLTWLG